MEGNSGPVYRVVRPTTVDEQIRNLAQQAKALGMRKAYLDALKVAVAQLARDPLGWGDPLYRTQHKGGIVYHRVYVPIKVQYVVYTVEKVVLLQVVTLIGKPGTPPPWDP